MLLFLTRAVDQMQQLWQTDGSEFDTFKVWQHTQQLMPIDTHIPEGNFPTQTIVINDANDLYIFGKETQEMNAELEKLEDAGTYRPPVIDEKRCGSCCQNSSIEYRLRLPSSEGELILIKKTRTAYHRVLSKEIQHQEQWREVR